MINKQMVEFPIVYTMPLNKTAIGWGVHETVATECKLAGIKKALIVTTSLRGTGIIDEIDHILTTQGISTEIFNKVTSNPKDHEIMSGYKVFRKANCDGVVSVGGGSSHDCGKCIRAVAANDGTDIREMAIFLDPPWRETIQRFKPITIPQIAVNTTAGTGAESSFAAAINNLQARDVQIVALPGMTPTTAIIDPLLVRLMPENITAWTGWDAFAHSFESYISKGATPASKALNWHSVKIIAENLKEFTYNRMNAAACEKMCWVANMSTVALHNGGGCGIVHGLASGLAALYGCHHGRSNAIMTPLEKYNVPSCPERFAEMAIAMGVDTRGMTTLQAADKWIDEVERLLVDLKIDSTNLNKQFGLKKEDLEHVVHMYANHFCREGNPRDYNFEDCIKLLENML
jgi:methanol:N,N-dimethyl-4-nitrosoaniline oxidoreductase